MTILKRTETYKCDGCGTEKADPIGWSYLTPMANSDRCDFRSGLKHYCDKCERAFPKPR